MLIGIGGWTARYLGPSSFGQLSYASAVVGVLAPIGSLGMRGSLGALLCEPKLLPGLVSSALFIEVIGTFLLAAVLMPWALLMADPVVCGLIGFMVLANLFNSSEVFEVNLLHYQRGTKIAGVDILQTLAGAIMSSMLLIFKAPLLVFGGLSALQSAIRCGLLAWSSRPFIQFNFWAEVHWPAVKALLVRGWPLIFAGLSVMIYMKSDQIMLQWMSGSAEVGQYSVAVRIAEAPYFIPMVIANTFLSRLGIDRFDENDSQIALKKLYKLAWLIGILLALATAFVLPFLALLVFGKHYNEAQAILVLLAPAAFAVATGCASGAWLNANGYTKIIALRSLVGACCNVILNFYFIPLSGASGAALATSVSQFVSVYLIGILDKSIRQNTALLIFPW